jgi:outer membrane lipoprotein-sorting protein
MTNILRRLPLSRLLLLCALALAIGVSATALAFALGGGPTPPPETLPVAIHDALAGAAAKPIEGLSANVTFTDRLLEGANLASGNDSGSGPGSGSGSLSSSPLVTGASGRLWVSKDGRVRLELQSQQGDTQILYDGHTLSVYDAATNTLYRYTPPAGEGDEGGGSGTDSSEPAGHEVPSVAKVEEAIARLERHADVSGASPTDVAGQPAYTVRVSPNEGGSLFAGVELTFDSVQGVPLRTAVYSTSSSTPVIELAASEVSYGPVESSVFELSPPSNVKVEDITLPHGAHPGAEHQDANSADKPKLRSYGHGPSAIAVAEAKAKPGEEQGAGGALEGLPKVSIDGVSASELRTELGTILTFERGGVRYLLAGSVAPAPLEALARGL